MIQSRTAVWAGLIASIVTIAVTAVSSDLVRTSLEGAYSYPNAEGLGLTEAASMTMTYLFAVAGLALVVAVAYLASQSLASSRTGWWVGAAFTAAGLAVAAYNATQAFPAAIKIVYFLPVVAGAAWLALPGSGASGRTTSNVPIA